MKFKNILSKINKLPCFKNNKKERDDSSYYYTSVLWNTRDNLIILISFSQDYFEEIIEIQDAINYTWQGLCSKIVNSSYEEDIIIKDEYGNETPKTLIHKIHYMLIGGETLAWQELYMNINNLGNEILEKITKEIKYNCDPTYFKNLIDDGVLYDFYENEDGKYPYDIPKKTSEGYTYTNPEVLIRRLPNGFTGRDILKFIKIFSPDHTIEYNVRIEISKICSMTDEYLKKDHLYPLYAAIIKDLTIDKLKMLLEPLYKQPDDDSIPGDMTDESLDSIFRERYERFSAVADDSMRYEDIDEELEDDEESENMREGDKIE